MTCDNLNMTTSNASQDSLLCGLNDKQLEAVTLPHQSALILAGAGSGKTRVLTTRIAWLIQTGQVSPTGLLAVTLLFLFTGSCFGETGVSVFGDPVIPSFCFSAAILAILSFQSTHSW